MATREDGHMGERAAINFFHDKGYEAYQLDAIVIKKEGAAFFIEAKVKNSKFITNRGEKDEFCGHGLDLSQAQSRMRIQEVTGLRVLFWALDTDEKAIYYRYLDELYSLKDLEDNMRTSNYYITKNDIIVFDINELKHVPLTNAEYKRVIREWKR